MLKRYRFWLWVAVVLLLMAAAIHSVGLFITPTSEDPTEIQMLALMMNHKMNMGLGFHPTMFNLFLALSSCFTFICVLAAFSNIFLLRKNVDPLIVRGLVVIQLITFGIAFLVVLRLTFLLPIVSIGLIVIALLMTVITTRNAGLPNSQNA